MNFNIFLGFLKNKYFLGDFEDFVDIFWGSSPNWTIFYGSFLCILGSFLKVNVQNGGYFFGLLKFQIFFGVLEIPDILGVRIDAGPEPTYQEKMRAPPGCIR